MAHISRAIILFLGIYYGSYLVASETAGGNNNLASSVEWQKMELEGQLTGKIRQLLSQIIPPELFMVVVEVVASAPKRPNFFQMQTEQQDKFDIKLTDQKTKLSPQSLLFRKFGMEAPLALGEGNRVTITQQTAMEQLWLYNQSMNIFNNLEAIEIVVNISDQVDVGQRPLVEKMLAAIKLPIANPQITINFVAYLVPLNLKMLNAENGSPKSKEVEKGEQNSSIIPLGGHNGDYASMIGMIVAGALMALALFFRRPSETLSGGASGSNIAASSLPPEPPLAATNNPTAAATGATSAESLEMPKLLDRGAIEKFQRLLQLNPAGALSLIRSWSNGEVVDHGILRILADQLATEDLMHIFTFLDGHERRRWRRRIEQIFTKEQMVQAQVRFLQQVVGEIVAPQVVLDQDLVALLLGIPPQRFIEILEYNANDGVLVLNLLSPDVMAKVVGQLPTKVMLAISQATLTLDIVQKLQATATIERLKILLRKFQDKTAELPGLDRLKDLLKSLPLSKEAALWDSLAGQVSNDELKNLLREIIPSSFFFQLPPVLLRGAVKKYPFDQQISLFAYLPGEQRQRLLDSYAPEGNLREMIDLELEKQQQNKVFLHQLEHHGDQIWLHFAHFIRQEIDGQRATYQLELEALVEQWMAAKTSTPDDSDSTLASAA